MLRDRHMQLVVHALWYAVQAVRIGGGDLDEVGAGDLDVGAESGVVVPGAAGIGIVEEGRLRQALGQSRLGRIERRHQLIEIERADPQHRIAQRIAAVDIESDPDTGGRTGGRGAAQHVLGDLEGIEVGVAITAAQHGDMRHCGGVLDIGIRIGVPLGGIQILGQEHRIVHTHVAQGGGAEIADEQHRLGSASGGDLDEDAERIAATPGNRQVFPGVNRGIAGRKIIDRHP